MALNLKRNIIWVNLFCLTVLNNRSLTSELLKTLPNKKTRSILVFKESAIDTADVYKYKIH